MSIIVWIICYDILITVAPEITIFDQLHVDGPGANVAIKFKFFDEIFCQGGFY